jgi:phosphate transport system substrate-binding protein
MRKLMEEKGERCGCIGDQIELEGAGATFPAPIYARWRALFQRANPGVSIHYRPVGSGRGIREISARNVDFGASDALLNDSESRALAAPLLAIPTVLGPVVLAYNLPKVEGQLTLAGEVVAGIYLGTITKWSDPRITAINPAIALPDLPIRVAHRSDSSGTTHIFTDYLSAVSEEWAERVGKGKRVLWPTGDDWSGEGNDGVAHRILLEPGGIGYLELKYAQNAGLRYAAMINRAGNRVWPSVASVQAAEESTATTGGELLKPSIVDAPGADAYPIAGFTYLLVYRDLGYMEPRKAHTLKRFIKWILQQGQPMASELHYTPLPEPLRREVLRQLDDIDLPALPAEAESEAS